MTVPDSWEARHGAIAEGIEVWLAGEVEDGFRAERERAHASERRHDA